VKNITAIIAAWSYYFYDDTSSKMTPLIEENA